MFNSEKPVFHELAEDKHPPTPKIKTARAASAPARAPQQRKPDAVNAGKLENTGEGLRSMENPIGAMFDLAETVSGKVPHIKKMIKYATIFISFSLIIDFILIIALLAGGQAFLFFLVMIFFFIGIFSLYMMRQVSNFFDYFSTRHIAIRMMREGDPVVHIPRGKNSLDQLLTHLKRSSLALENLLRSNPGALQAPVILKGLSGIEYSFDAYISVPPSTGWKLFGVGRPGYALVIKTLPDFPKMRELRALENAIADVVRVTRIPPGRAIILIENKQGKEPLLPDDVYEHLTGSRFVVRAGNESYVCNLQVISVDQDGTYDFVPMISTLPTALP